MTADLRVEARAHGADVERLAAAGIAAMLVGESLLVQPDPGAAAAALLGTR